MSLQERDQDTDREFIKIACKVGNLRRLTSVSSENTGVKSGTQPVTIKTPANSICEPNKKSDDKVMLIGVDAHGTSNLMTRSSTMVVALRLLTR